MLDLTLYSNSNKYYEVKMLDGKVLKLKRPSQVLFMEVMDIKKFVDEKDVEKSLDGLYEIFTKIVNMNIDGEKYEKEDIENEYDLQLVSILINDYFAYWSKEIAEKVDFQ